MKVNRRVIRNEAELKQLLDEMYQSAKAGRSFYGLTEMLTNEEIIITAMHNIKSNHGSKTAGLDGKTIDDYLQMDMNHIIDMINKQL